MDVDLDRGAARAPRSTGSAAASSLSSASSAACGASRASAVSTSSAIAAGGGASNSVRKRRSSTAEIRPPWCLVTNTRNEAASSARRLHARCHARRTARRDIAQRCRDRPSRSRSPRSRRRYGSPGRSGARYVIVRVTGSSTSGFGGSAPPAVEHALELARAPRGARAARRRGVRRAGPDLDAHDVGLGGGRAQHPRAVIAGERLAHEQAAQHERDVAATVRQLSVDASSPSSGRRRLPLAVVVDARRRRATPAARARASTMYEAAGRGRLADARQHDRRPRARRDRAARQRALDQQRLGDAGDQRVAARRRARSACFVAAATRASSRSSSDRRRPLARGASR